MGKLYNISLSQYPCFQKLTEDFYLIFDEVYGEEFVSYTIDDYYYAWKLRGDNPYCYDENGKIRINYLTEYDKYALNSNINSHERREFIAKLYYAYHFDYDIKMRGKEIYDFKVNDGYKEVMKVIQKRMQFEIARKGIFVECNPTSNYLIAKLERYEYHPIINFYDDGLNYNNKDCAQINVSINTDDQGVFDTSLENEYALMAYSLEYMTENGKYVFTPYQVYKWIDNVRNMGLIQSFKK